MGKMMNKYVSTQMNEEEVNLIVLFELIRPFDDLIRLCKVGQSASSCYWE